MKAPKRFRNAYTIQPKLFIGDWEGFATPFGAVVRRVSPELLAHEASHVDQWWRYYVIGFPFVYGYQLLRYGYWAAPLEIDARAAGIKATTGYSHGR